MKKKHLLLVLRCLIAIAGIAFIVANLNLGDQVQVPAGTRLPDGRTVGQTADLRVISGTFDPSDPQGQLVVELIDENDQAHPITIPTAALNMESEGDGLRYVPGLMAMIRGANAAQLLLGLLVVAVIYPITTVRWWLLLRAREIDVPIWKAFRLTMVGMFFNFCMPGSTGGDVVKAYYAAKGSKRRADTVVTVIVDRVCGLLGLLGLAGCAGLFMLHNDLTRRLTVTIWLIVLGVAIGALVYYSRILRRAIGVDWLLTKRPAKRILVPVDQAVFAYRNHKTEVVVAILMSLAVHLSLVSGTVLAAYALGIQSSFGVLVVVLPVTFLVGAIPIAPPQGIGVMEFIAVMLLTPPLAYPNQVIGMLMMVRLYQMCYALSGSAFLLKGDIHLHPQETVQPPAGDQPG